MTEAARVHAAGVTGYGVTIAFVDSGYYCMDNLNRNDRGQNRILAGLRRDQRPLDDAG